MALLIDLEERINSMSGSQTRIENDLEDKKKALKIAIADAIKTVMTDDDFIQNEDYNAFLGSDDDSETKRNDWIDSLSLEEKIHIIAEHAVIGEGKEKDGWQKALSEAQKNKQIVKATSAKTAEETIAAYKELKDNYERKILEPIKKQIIEQKNKIKEKEREIQRLSSERDRIEKKIENISERISKNVAALNSKKAQPTQAQIDMVKVEIENLNAQRENAKSKLNDLNDKIEDQEKELEGLNDDLENLQNTYDEYTKEDQIRLFGETIDTKIQELEDSMLDQGIYVGRYKEAGNEAKTPEVAQTTNGAGNNVIMQGGTVNQDSKTIAEHLFEELKNASPEKTMKIISQFGYDDLLDMSRTLGPIRSLQLYRTIGNRLEDLKWEDRDGVDKKGNPIKIKSKKFTVKDSDGNLQQITIDMKDLQNLSKMKVIDFEKIKTLMRYYTENYQDLSVQERKEADEVMNYLKISVLMTEASKGNIRLGKGIANIQSFFHGVNRKRSRITELGNSLRDYATERGKREKAIKAKEQSLRTTLKVKNPVVAFENPRLQRTQTHKFKSRDD